MLGRIGPGLVVLVGICRDDVEQDADYLVAKTLNLRVFGDDDGRFNLAAGDVGAELLVISQFTLYVYAATLFFFVVLFIGFAYEWKTGAFDWVRAVTRTRNPSVATTDLSGGGVGSGGGIGKSG